MSIPPTATPPGWYPDPAGTSRPRYWDGAGWTEHYVDPLVGAAPGGAVQQPPLRTGARLNTPFIWILVLLPLLTAIAGLFWNLQGYLEQSIRDPTRASLALYSDPGYLAQLLTSVVVYAATVVLAYFDWRALGRMGIVRPFHWAWSFLSIVYIIGRPVVLRRRVHRGLAPLLLFIAVYVVSVVLVIAKFAIAFSALSGTLSGVAGLGGT